MGVHFYVYLFAVKDLWNSATKISRTPAWIWKLYRANWPYGTPPDKHIRRNSKKYWKLFSLTFLDNGFIHYEMLEVGLGAKLGENLRRYFNVKKNFREKFILLSFSCDIVSPAPMMLVVTLVSEISCEFCSTLLTSPWYIKEALSKEVLGAVWIGLCNLMIKRHYRLDHFMEKFVNH